MGKSTRDVHGDKEEGQTDALLRKFVPAKFEARDETITVNHTKRDERIPVDRAKKETRARLRRS